MNTYSHYAESFLLPLLGAILAGILIYGLNTKWPIRKYLWIMLSVPLIALAVTWSIAPNNSSERKLIVAGTVLDDSNEPAAVGQATITAVNGGESSRSDDDGNFVLQLAAGTEAGVRLRITKDGYSAYEATVKPPTHTFVVRLHRL